MSKLSGTLLDPLTGISQPCTLVAIEPGYFRVEAEYRLQLGDEVNLYFGAAAVRAEVTVCSRSGERFLLGLTLLADQPGHERRREPRVPVEWSGTLTELARPEPDIAATVVNFSPSGIALESSRKLEVNSHVAMDTEAALLFGEVCNSSPSSTAEGLFLSGVRLIEVFPKTNATGASAGFGRFWRNLLTQHR